jgi:hypothetical protein
MHLSWVYDMNVLLYFFVLIYPNFYCKTLSILSFQKLSQIKLAQT